MSLLSQGGERLRVLRQILRVRALVDPFEIQVHQVSYKKKRTLMFVYLFFITIKHATRVDHQWCQTSIILQYSRTQMLLIALHSAHELGFSQHTVHMFHYYQ